MGRQNTTRAATFWSWLLTVQVLPASFGLQARASCEEAVPTALEVHGSHLCRRTLTWQKRHVFQSVSAAKAQTLGRIPSLCGASISRPAAPAAPPVRFGVNAVSSESQLSSSSSCAKRCSRSWHKQLTHKLGSSAEEGLIGRERLRAGLTEFRTSVGLVLLPVEPAPAPPEHSPVPEAGTDCV